MSATVLSAHHAATHPAEAFDGLGMDTPAQDLLALYSLSLSMRMEATKRFRHPVFLEVGSWVGRTALVLDDCLPSGRGHVYCVDTFQGSGMADKTGLLAWKHGPAKVFETFCKNVGPRLFKSIIPCKGTSLEWAAIWPAHLLLDLVFIDAGHTYEQVKADIAAWSPHVRKSGIMAFHDYGFELFPGVKKAVDEFGKDGVEGTVAWKCIK